MRIDEIMARKRDETTLSNSCPDSWQKMTLAKLGTREEFLEKFNPNYQQEICANTDECFFGDYPTLVQLKQYGVNMPVMWLLPQLYNLSEYCGCKDKLTQAQMMECAYVIATEWYYLKISEVMLFFHRFKSGRYGRFYGAVDSMTITSSLWTFVKERNSALIRHDQEEREKREKESMKNAITWEEYSMSKYGYIKDNPLTQ